MKLCKTTLMEGDYPRCKAEHEAIMAKLNVTSDPTGDGCLPELDSWKNNQQKSLLAKVEFCNRYQSLIVENAREYSLQKVAADYNLLRLGRLGKFFKLKLRRIAMDRVRPEEESTYSTPWKNFALRQTKSWVYVHYKGLPPL